MVGFETEKEKLDALGVKVVAASVDAEDKAKEVADEVSFPVGYGITRDQADLVRAWWGEDRGIIQPSEFLLDENGVILLATYSSGPLGRVDAADVVRNVTRRESMKNK